MHAKPPRRLTSWTSTRLLSALLLASVGCVSTVEHTPNTGLVADLGVEACREALREAALNASDPPLLSAEVTEDALVYTYRAYVPDTMTPIEPRDTLRFAEISRFEIYENKRVTAISLDGDRVSTFRFSTLEECQRWVDLILSLKAHPAAGH